MIPGGMSSGVMTLLESGDLLFLITWLTPLQYV
jgi:hypothetical protein